MRYTDIVKARALRRAGRACEMCGTPVSFDSARFVSAHPIFGILFDQDDCCVLCEDCLVELDPETRAVAEQGPRASLGGHEVCDDLPSPEPRPSDAHADGPVQNDPAMAGSAEPGGSARMPRPARDTWVPESDPGGDMCA